MKYERSAVGCFINRIDIANVVMDKLEIRVFENTLYILFGAVREIVVATDIKSAIYKRMAKMRSYKPRSPRD